MEPWNRFATDAQEEPADFYRLVLTKVLDDLMDQVGGISQIEEVKIALRKISHMYKGGLSIASSQYRSDWSNPANRCAYVFLYLMQHCHLVYFSLEQCTSRILNSWRNKSNLKVCSIGGGPGSDLVGLTTFLRTHGIFPPSLECRVLDLYPNWKDTWDTIHQCIPQYFRVAYERCDVVRDMGLTVTTHRFIRQADMLTLVKLFSAVSAFFRADPGRGDLLRSILREIKPGCFVLYVDNQHDIDTQFEKEFASQLGLVKVFEFRGKPTLPFGQYSSTVRRYHDELQCWPLSSCNVLIQLYEKLAVQPGTISQVHETQIPPQHFGSSVIDRVQLGLHRRVNIDDRPSSSSQPRYSSFPAQRDCPPKLTIQSSSKDDCPPKPTLQSSSKGDCLPKVTLQSSSKGDCPPKLTLQSSSKGDCLPKFTLLSSSKGDCPTKPTLQSSSKGDCPPKLTLQSSSKGDCLPKLTLQSSSKDDCLPKFTLLSSSKGDCPPKLTLQSSSKDDCPQKLNLQPSSKDDCLPKLSLQSSSKGDSPPKLTLQ
ncbi:uncharacterized protein LOC119727861 [Patiria miniata]|uniref:Uncharacterized protein n=1 Tax=Patiria miniata TaxID=46514 RepID=A0A913ZW34_PATMI|nr:uncharacterized protein LOC119727861 [Patiria miniata]